MEMTETELVAKVKQSLEDVEQYSREIAELERKRARKMLKTGWLLHSVRTTGTAKGNWAAWMKSNLPGLVDERTARRYIQRYEKYQEEKGQPVESAVGKKPRLPLGRIVKDDSR